MAHSQSSALTWHAHSPTCPRPAPGVELWERKAAAFPSRRESGAYLNGSREQEASYGARPSSASSERTAAPREHAFCHQLHTGRTLPTPQDYINLPSSEVQRYQVHLSGAGSNIFQLSITLTEAAGGSAKCLALVFLGWYRTHWGRALFTESLRHDVCAWTWSCDRDEVTFGK